MNTFLFYLGIGFAFSSNAICGWFLAVSLRLLCAEGKLSKLVSEAMIVVVLILVLCSIFALSYAINIRDGKASFAPLGLIGFVIGTSVFLGLYYLWTKLWVPMAELRAESYRKSNEKSGK
jgi:Kef-type K+ transport system membrane component KefB